MKTQALKGMRDLLPAEQTLRDYIQGKILETYRASGFERISTPMLEDMENLDKSDGGDNLNLIFKVMKRGDKLTSALGSGDPGLIRCQTCVSAYISTAFLCGGTVTDPQKAYNLEFLTGRTNLAKDFEALLAEHEFAPHRTRRNGVNLIYVKSSASVERILAFMGAAEASARMNAQKAVKQLRNQINRQTNCDTANLGKTARANAQTTRAIRFLQEQGALETLPEVLQQAAAMRMENPDLSLTALCACFGPPVSKSGLSHRMKKLEALAENLRQNLEQEAQRERDQ